uniref:Myb_DNA-bind_3 domain-containing protein n=1 Tax=Steinernema glaseri TaxID=37863 RepID=A0A1I8A9Q1_9BILA
MSKQQTTYSQKYTEDEFVRIWKVIIAELKKDDTQDPTSKKFWKAVKANQLYDKYHLFRSATAYATKMKKAWDDQEVHFLDIDDQAFLLRVLQKRIAARNS